MAMVRNIKKQDDKYLTALRELVTNGGSGGNRQCFDCGQKGPTYVNMTIGSFVCTRCSGVLRGLTPPHRVKSISMATFTQDEIDFLKAHGNNECAKTWLGLWDPKRAVHQDHRELMIDKYERKRYYLEPASPLKSLTNAASLISKTTTNNTTTTTSNGNGQIHTTDAAKTKTENGLTNGNKQQQQIHLKPPNGMRKSHSYNNNNNNNNTTTTNGSKNNDVTAINRVHQMENAFNLKQSANKLLSENNSTTTTATTESGFGADTNFVADFGTANIFNATTPAATAPTTNGYAKIQQQSNKIAQQQQQQYNTITNNRTSNNNNNNNKNNNKNYQFMNGGQEATTTTTTTQLTNGSNNNENFADFDHAPIYNAAGNNLGINDTNGGHSNNVNGNMKYQFVRKTNIRKKPPLYDLQQLALQQKRQNDASEQQQQDKFNDEFVYPTRSTATRSFSIDDIFFTNEIEQQQQQEKQEIINDRNLSANTDTNPFCDKNNSYFSFNEEDPFNHNARTKQQQQQLQAKENINMNKQKKFTPLALAAHATAMAVLQKDYHFNNDHNKHVSFSDGFSQQKINKHVFDNNQFNINDDENENENEDDDDWYTGGGLEWRSYTTSTTTNENESPNDTKLKSIIGQQHQLQQTPSKSEYNQNSSTTYDVYNTTWCTNDLHEYNNQYNNNSNNNNSNCNFVGFSNNDNNNTLGNIGNGDGNFIYMDKSTTVNSTPSFPISKGIHNTSANNNIDNQRNNGKLNRTPSEDRYAALKDLDEQLRESKSFTDVFATNNMNSNGSINPFKSQHAQQQQQQQQQHIQAPQTAQQQIMANPFQTQPAANYYQAQMNIMPNNPQNMAGMSAQNYYNYNNNNNNRYVMGQHGLGANNMQGPNGCGFGFNTMQQDKMVNAAAEDFNNPFVVNGSMNSNNPFL